MLRTLCVFILFLWVSISSHAAADPLVNYQLGLQAQAAGKSDEAKQRFLLSLEQLNSAGEGAGGYQSYPLGAIALLHYQEGALGAALEAARLAEDYASTGDPGLLAALYSARLVVAQVQTDVMDPRADQTWSSLGDLARQLTAMGDPVVASTYVNNYAEHLRQTGKIREAIDINRALLEERLAIPLRTAYDRRTLHTSYINLAASYGQIGAFRQAEELYKTVIVEAREQPYETSQEVYGIAASDISFLLSQEKRIEEAKFFAEISRRALEDQKGSRWLTATNHLAIALQLDGENEAAAELFKTVYQGRLALMTGSPIEASIIDVTDPGFETSGFLNADILISAGNLAESLHRSGRLREALAYFDSLARIYDAVGQRVSAPMVQSLVSAGLIRSKLGDPETGLQNLRLAQEIAAALPNESLRLQVDYNMGLAKLALGDSRSALGLIAPYSEALLGYSDEIDVTVETQLSFERFNRAPHVKLMQAAWRSKSEPAR